MNSIKNTQQITILPKDSVSKDDYVPIPVARKQDFLLTLIAIIAFVIFFFGSIPLIVIPINDYKAQRDIVSTYEHTTAIVTEIKEMTRHISSRSGRSGGMDKKYYLVKVLHTVNGIDYDKILEYPNTSDIDNGKVKVGDNVKILAKPGEPWKMSFPIQPKLDIKIIMIGIFQMILWLAVFISGIRSRERRLIKDQLNILNNPDVYPVLVKAGSWFIREEYSTKYQSQFVCDKHSLSDVNMKYTLSIIIEWSTGNYNGILKQVIPPVCKTHGWCIDPAFDDIIIWVVNPYNMSHYTRYYIPYSCKALNSPYKGVKISKDNEQ